MLQNMPGMATKSTSIKVKMVKRMLRARNKAVLKFPNVKIRGRSELGAIGGVCLVIPQQKNN